MIKLYSTQNAADFLKVTPRTMERWRIEGQGPRWIKIGGRRVAADRRAGRSSWGYGFFLPNAIRFHLDRRADREIEEELTGLSPVFYAVAWDLCRRGVIRPGLALYGGQATDEGASGNGYSLTPFGEEWLEHANDPNFIPTDPTRQASLLARHEGRFGLGYHQRSQEAVRCYNSQAFLACCAMCGASAEPILLAMAISKTGDEEHIINRYSRAGGRGNVENLLIGQAGNEVRGQFDAYMGLLRYWRDASAHGRPVDFDENEAATSLVLLIRFANFANDRWDTLTA